MRKVCFVFFVFTAAVSVFAQRQSSVGIFPFEAAGQGVSEEEAEEATRRVIAELGSWGDITVLEGAEAETGNYLVRGQIARTNNQFVLTAAVSDARTGKTLNIAKEQGQNLDAVSMETFCAQVTENVPYPNYLLGRWRSVITMPDGPVTCVLEFRADRTIRVAQFDTWEHNGTNSLKYQAVGRGTYSYAGYRRRTVTLGGRQVQTDATVGISLTLEDALPKYTSVNAGGLRVLFDESKSAFDLSYGGIPCGDNLTGASVYPSANVYYTKFSKIQ